jgi:hypothetical protein
VVINQLVEVCGETGQFYGFAGQGEKRTQFPPGRNLLERPISSFAKATEDRSNVELPTTNDK